MVPENWQKAFSDAQNVQSLGGGCVDWVTVTSKVQLAVCPSLDCALTATDVVPTGKLLPEGGLPVTVTGATPPDVVALYVTTTGDPFCDTTDLFAGHVTVSGPGGGGGGGAEPTVAVTWTV